MGKDTIIRAGDFVRIDKPLFFVRVGYPKNIASESLVVADEFGKDIDALMEKTGIRSSLYLTGRDACDRVREKIIKEISYARLHRCGFGGKERSIYTKEILDFAGNEFHVLHTRFVKTGVYHSGNSGYSLYGDDYEPAELCDQKTHKILCLDNFLGTLEIESCHVTKLESKNDNFF